MEKARPEEETQGLVFYPEPESSELNLRFGILHRGCYGKPGISSKRFDGVEGAKELVMAA
ncbi:hypothetical protein TDIS_1413 [Thermosulfurimonas dismutans]|uniref:Uncharacterized protein n=1 Tax=Thermosulfurimonas dismutans TaxID=999894 RepID=A0A179D349_9BACT|nr:hypothetical protein TDIS_1413 [Thermosulfurimonas dismutans]